MSKYSENKERIRAILNKKELQMMKKELSNDEIENELFKINHKFWTTLKWANIGITLQQLMETWREKMLRN